MIGLLSLARTIPMQLGRVCLRPGPATAPLLRAAPKQPFSSSTKSEFVPKQFGQLPTTKFLPSSWMKTKEVLPIIVIMISVVVGVSAFSIYAAISKQDVSFNHHAPPRWESMDLMHPTPKKLLTYNQTYEPNPELHDVLEEMKDK